MPRLALPPLLALLAAGCGGIVVSRELAQVKPAEVIYDDLCRLQPWFDGLSRDPRLAPAIVSATEIEHARSDGAMGGRDTFRFEPGPARDQFLRLLAAHYTRLPPELGRARRLELEVEWASRAAVKRAVTDRSATLIIDGRGRDLPYHVCLSDFVYGEPLYRTRRDLRGGR